MGLFERVVFRSALSNVINNASGSDQFAYRKQATILPWPWLSASTNGNGFIVMLTLLVFFSFDFSQAFDSVPHGIVCRKLIYLEINPYIHNSIVNFLKGKQQRVVVDGISTSYLSTNGVISKGTVSGPNLFSIMINDIKAVNPSSKLLVKYADDIS